jgi:hypothetical protein
MGLFLGATELSTGGGGGGGFTKMKKYSTGSSTGETTNPQEIMAPGLTPAEQSAVGQPNVRVSSISNGGTTAGLSTWRIGTAFWTGYADQTLPQDFFVGARFELLKTTGGYETITVTASTAGFISDNNATNTTITFNAFDSGGSGAFNDNTTQYTILPPLLTFNPQTEGMSDGDSIGYFIVGSGQNAPSSDFAGAGGKILRGTSIITNASTNLVLTPGTGNNVASTISGGLTLSSANGIRFWGGMTNNVDEASSASSGINGYGAGGNARNKAGGMLETYHGFGGGGGYLVSAADGAILLFY